MTHPDRAPARPPGWIGHLPGYDAQPGGDLLPPRPELPPPPRWIFHAVCAVATLWLFWTSSTPAPNFFDGSYAALVLLGAAAVWVFRLVVAMTNRAPVELWWAVAPLGGVLTVVLLVTDAPLHARFSLADGELGEVAREVAAAPDPAAVAKELDDLGRVGTYRVSGVDADGSAVYFTFRTGDGFFGGPSGMAYIPGPDPAPAPGVSELVHFRGPWYIWTAPGAD